jgi:hypothetical protein
MKEMVICKSCGFIMEKGKVGDRCPACGVPSKMFQPHDERISPRRKLLLSLDIHPVLVHFPQAFSATILLLSIAGIVIHGYLQMWVLSTLRTMAVVLPFTIAISFAAGLFDAKIRFRKVTTPLLKKKIILGSIFFLFSCAIAAAVLNLPFTLPLNYLVIIGLSLPALGCAAGLGLIGTSLLPARFPG